MVSRSESQVPRLAGALTAERLRTLPLSPADGYLLSRIDGSSSVEELAEALGLELDGVVVSIIKLESLGLVVMPKAERGERQAREESRAARAPSPASRPTPRARIAREETVDEEPPPPPSPAPVVEKPREKSRFSSRRSSMNILATKPGRKWRPSGKIGAATERDSVKMSGAKPARHEPAPAEPSSARPDPTKTRTERPPASMRGRAESPPTAAKPPSTPPASKPAPSRPPPSRPASVRPAPPRPPSEQPAAEKPASEGPAAERPASATPAPPSSVVAAAPAPSGPKIGDGIDLELDHRAQIDDLFSKLGQIDHYGLLGLDGGADKKAVKRAYFELTGRFHPDRFFRKNLGPYKTKMEAIFVRMTEAHDTLTRDQRRAEYDAYLESIDESRKIERMVASAMSEVQKAEDAVRASVPAAPISEPQITAKGPPPAPMPTQTYAESFAPEPTTSTRSFRAELGPGRVRISVASLDEEAAEVRKDMLARRLTGRPGRMSPSSSGDVPSGASVPPTKPAPAEAVDALKRRYEETVSAARASQSRKYRESGMAARERGDFVAAANALRVALSFDEGNAELKAACDEAQLASERHLADQYAKQGDYEEKAEKWGDAARSWARVARGRPDDVKAHERAAYCLLKSSGDLHQASTLAQRAVLLAPKELQNRVTLANVYLAAGLAKNAKRELEAAAAIAPDDQAVAALLKRLGKTG